MIFLQLKKKKKMTIYIEREIENIYMYIYIKKSNYKQKLLVKLNTLVLQN